MKNTSTEVLEKDQEGPPTGWCGKIKSDLKRTGKENSQGLGEEYNENEHSGGGNHKKKTKLTIGE